MLPPLAVLVSAQIAEMSKPSRHAGCRLGSRLGQCPDEIIIFGVQPGGIAPAMGLTEELAGRVDEYVELIAAELAT